MKVSTGKAVISNYILILFIGYLRKGRNYWKTYTLFEFRQNGTI